MKRIKGVAVLLVLAAAMSAGASQARAAEIKIGSVDLDRALNESEKGRAALAKITKKFEAVARQVDEKKNEIKKLQDDLEAQAAALSDEARAERIQDYKDKTKEFDRFRQDKQEELKREKFEASKKIELEIRQVVQRLGKQQGYTIVLEKTEFYPLYVDAAVDLTSEVIAAYNAEAGGAGQ